MRRRACRGRTLVRRANRAAAKDKPRRTRFEGSLLAGRSPAPRGAAHGVRRSPHAQAKSASQT